MKNKIVYNACHGGFGLSRKAINRLLEIHPSQIIIGAIHDEIAVHDELGWKNYDSFDIYAIPRHDPYMVQVVEEMGQESFGCHAELAILEIEGDTYRIEEYDGAESVETPNTIEWVHIS